MSSPKKIGRWNRFEIAFNGGNWPKPSAPSRALEKTRSLRKMEKRTSGSPFVDFASLDETPGKGSPEEKTPLDNAASSEETPIRAVASSPTLWTEARKETKAAKKGRTRR